ncbi:hypothetical protein [Oceanobacillus timonensis]|uniref:hypothetical protein n=1 Tax=Oceanobacillus timonensis TaxID=1926285 RepID=UPI0015C4A53F|nr:hypothetical protein [Oceanobacillus timonensis]
MNPNQNNFYKNVKKIHYFFTFFIGAYYIFMLHIVLKFGLGDFVIFRVLCAGVQEV